MAKTFGQKHKNKRRQNRHLFNCYKWHHNKQLSINKSKQKDKKWQQKKKTKI